MTTYTAISSGSLAVGKPLTSAIALALRDNPIAIAEGDASVPSNLLGTRLLGTLTTTSGNIQTLSSLTLTPYKFLLMIWVGVSKSHTGGTFNIGVATDVMVALTSSASNTVSGFALIELTSGMVTGLSAETGWTNAIKVGLTGYSTATTTVSVSTSAGGTFDAGSVTVYGVK